ncbi:MAG: hypothetical protein ACTSW2_00855 [Alphaproteobacteria bacterium]
MRGSRPPLPGPALPNEGIYRLILLLMVAAIVCGAILAIAGETVAQNQALSRLGTGMALIGGVIYAFFRWLGIREASRHTRQPPADPPDTNSDP